LTHGVELSEICNEIYIIGDLLLTGVAGQQPGRCPGLCAQAVGGGMGGRAAPLVT